MHSYVARFDESMTLLVERLPSRLTPLMRTVSATGLPATIVTAALLLATASWLSDAPNIAYAQLACLVALGGNTIIKHVVHRPRPDTIYVGNMKIQSYSFPSGHTFGSTVFYGLCAYLVYVHLSLLAAVVAVAIFVLVIVLVGISRIFLGAHFPSDVLLGWILGGLSLLLIIKLFLL